MKRWIDVTASLAVLGALAPLLAVVAVAILLDDGLPVLFRQLRVGKDGQPFTFLKFRSMGRDSEERTSADASELRITRVGGMLRRLNLDEIPQLVNVVRGEMSLVGPRPAIPAQGRLSDLRANSGALRCLPGLTGLAQVMAYDGMPEEEKAAWDAQYAANVTLLNDVRIVLRTLTYLLRPSPTY